MSVASGAVAGTVAVAVVTAVSECAAGRTEGRDEEEGAAMPVSVDPKHVDASALGLRTLSARIDRAKASTNAARTARTCATAALAIGLVLFVMGLTAIATLYADARTGWVSARSSGGADARAVLAPDTVVALAPATEEVDAADVVADAPSRWAESELYDAWSALSSEPVVLAPAEAEAPAYVRALSTAHKPSALEVMAAFHSEGAAAINNFWKSDKHEPPLLPPKLEFIG